MKKQYVNPTMEVVEMNTKCNILAGSGGLTTGSTTGEEYTSTDVSYSRESDWDE